MYFRSVFHWGSQRRQYLKFVIGFSQNLYSICHHIWKYCLFRGRSQAQGNGLHLSNPRMIRNISGSCSDRFFHFWEWSYCHWAKSLWRQLLAQNLLPIEDSGEVWFEDQYRVKRKARQKNFLPQLPRFMEQKNKNSKFPEPLY